jgi:hypothetical protein
VWAAILALDQRDEERLRRHAQTLNSGDPVYGVRQIGIFASALAGLVEVLAGRSEVGLERVREARADSWSAEPAAPGLNAILMRILLEARAAAGEAEAGLAAADEALEMGGGAQLWEAEARRLRAEFLAGLGAARREIETELERAIEVAERQGARSFELRARESRDRFRAGTL